MIGFKLKGDFSKTTRYLQQVRQASRLKVLEKYGQIGVDALSKATPVDSGLTASSWYYKVESTNTYAKIMYCNSNVNKGVPIAIILQTGHGTRNGGWVEGRDYINPAIQPVFDELVNRAWGEVTKL